MLGFFVINERRFNFRIKRVFHIKLYTKFILRDSYVGKTGQAHFLCRDLAKNTNQREGEKVTEDLQRLSNLHLPNTRIIFLSSLDPFPFSCNLPPYPLSSLSPISLLFLCEKFNETHGIKHSSVLGYIADKPVDASLLS